MIPCSQCHTTLTADAINTTALANCSHCGARQQVDVYPALVNGLATGQTGERLLNQKEASCFYHPEKRAHLPCSACGRFMCALCDIELEGKHICPICLENGKTSEKMTRLVDRRVSYDRIALMVALLPILTIWFTIITAPIALFLSIRYWNAPLSIVSRTRIRFILAIIAAVIQIVLWVLFFFNLAA